MRAQRSPLTAARVCSPYGGMAAAPILLTKVGFCFIKGLYILRIIFRDISIKSSLRRQNWQREKQVLQLIAQGYANKNIAGKLKISLSTVKNHRLNLSDKLGLKTTAALVKYAILKGLDWDRIKSGLLSDLFRKALILVRGKIYNKIRNGKDLLNFTQSLTQSLRLTGYIW